MPRSKIHTEKLSGMWKIQSSPFMLMGRAHLLEGSAVRLTKMGITPRRAHSRAVRAWRQK